MKALGIISLAVLTTILNGWVLCRLWFWFIATTFHTSPLSIPQAIGIAIVLGAMHPQPTQSDSEVEKGIGYHFALAVIRPLLSLGIGYVVHLFL